MADQQTNDLASIIKKRNIAFWFAICLGIFWIVFCTFLYDPTIDLGKQPLEESTEAIALGLAVTGISAIVQLCYFFFVEVNLRQEAGEALPSWRALILRMAVILAVFTWAIDVTLPFARWFA
ncbi:MAG: hypothetical protein HC871_02220 [Rhizobiales bacterium]|nr:hypothetical protein [Hyphomicrobiales bacterium]